MIQRFSSKSMSAISDRAIVTTSFSLKLIAAELSESTSGIRPSTFKSFSISFRFTSLIVDLTEGVVEIASSPPIALIRSFRALISRVSKSLLMCVKSTPRHSRSSKVGFSGRSCRSCVSSRFVRTDESESRSASPAFPGTVSTLATNSLRDPNS